MYEKKVSIAAIIKQPRVRIFVIALAIFVIIIGAFRMAADKRSDDTQAAQTLRENDFKRDVKRAYEEKTASIVTTFVSEEGLASVEQRLLLIDKTKQSLLALTVPVDYKDLHLQLVIALSEIAAGERGDTVKLVEGQKKLQEAIASQTWLR